MAYIGKQPVVGNFQVCDAISVVNGQAAYTMQVNSTNVEPENANHMLVSLNGILQKPGSSFTISGSTITFASNLATGDVIDFIILLGDTLNVGTPSDDSVGAAQIKNDLISGTTALASEPDDTDEFLVSDAGTLKRIDYSLIKGGGITVADNWRLSADDAVDSSETDLDSNWERVDTTGQGFIGSAMTQSSGVFTFPSTGIYYIHFQIRYYGGSGGDYGIAAIRHHNGSGTTTVISEMRSNYGSGDSMCISTSTLFDCQNTSTDKVIFYGGGNTNGNAIEGESTKNRTSAVFIRLGDT